MSEDIDVRETVEDLERIKETLQAKSAWDEFKEENKVNVIHLEEIKETFMAGRRSVYKNLIDTAEGIRRRHFPDPEFVMIEAEEEPQTPRSKEIGRPTNEELAS